MFLDLESVPDGLSATETSTDLLPQSGSQADTPIEQPGRGQRHAGAAAPGATRMRARSGGVYGDDLGRRVGSTLDPDRGAAVSRAGVDAVEQLLTGDAIKPLGMFPLRAYRLVGGIAGNMQQPRGAQAFEFGRRRRPPAEEARRRGERTFEKDQADIGFR